MRNEHGIPVLPVSAVEGDYHQPNHTIYLKLDEHDLVSLRIALADALAKHGVKMCHEEIVEAPDGIHPDSHIGKLVQLYRRTDAAFHGRKTWNAEWRNHEPHNRVARRR